MRNLKLARTLLLCAVFTFSLSAVWAHAQSIPLPSTNYSSAITTSNTFQQIQGVTNNRNGCTIQNNGTHTMYVYFGTVANATEAAAAQLAPGQSLSCSIASDFVVKDAISITGTAGDSFFANFQ